MSWNEILDLQLVQEKVFPAFFCRCAYARSFGESWT